MKRKNKYGNKKCQYMGMNFDSKGEMQRYIFLKDQENSGMIKNLQRQVKYRLDINGKHICSYVADFVYDIPGIQDQVVEDYKKIQTPVFRIKLKMMEAIYGIKIRIVKDATCRINAE